jgi:substrate import-associated zinc metallohydrolase lipoprotein
LSASDLNFQLTPADYNRSQLLAHFIQYLFYEVYTKYAGEDFMKKYGPRIFHFIGSSGFSPTTGTEVLGTASGGVKITLYKINEMKPYSEGVTYSGEDVNVLNENYFHTMHHEFSHVLHQTKSYPVTFGQVTSGSYDPINWQDRDSVWTHQNGYVTHYASSATYEDFVETLSCIITDTKHRWMNRIINAASMGVRQGDKEDILELIDSLDIDLDAPQSHWNNFTLYEESEYNDQTGEYESTERYVLDEHRLMGAAYQVVNKEATAYVAQYKYKEFRKFTSFKNDFLPWVKISTEDDLTGINSLLKKLDIATKWYTENWGLYVFTLRREVAERQSNINDYLQGVTIYDLE